MRVLVPSMMLGLVASLGFAPADRPAGPVDFARDVRPILSAHCFACHGPDEASREADLSLVEREAALAVIRPGDRAASELWRRINDAGDPMPPADEHNALTAEQIDVLGRWIDEGAGYAKHWAYATPTRVPLSVPDGEDVIDAVLADRFRAARLDASGPAEPTTLFRRLSLDLRGVPPSLDELDAFLVDPSVSAYASWVDRFLGSAQFGEWFAVGWLDLVRYADSVGYHGDQEHHAWAYRDWVIAALNDNVPFDRFSIAQLAGDLLPEPTDDDVAAATYNRLLQTTHEGGLQLKEYRAIYLADRVRNAAEVWLGGTLGCAQCHDHKYDPYTMRDFYAFGAFFADIDDEEHLRNPYGGLNTSPTPRVPELSLASADQLAEEQQLSDVVAAAKAEVAAIPKDEKERRKAAQQAVRRATNRLRSYRRSMPKLLLTRALDEPREVRVLPRGNWLDESGEVVEPAVPAFLGALETDGRATRLDLARWLFAPRADGGIGELTARVFVNRLWRRLFGEGLCISVEDFGGQGRPPTYPVLLDELALDFVASGWDVKALVRRLVTTTAYRRSSVPTPSAAAADPENERFARQHRDRLPAEGVRDAILSIGGLLVDGGRGPSVKPPQPAGYYRHLQFPPRRYVADAPDRANRRSVYVHWQRQYLHPVFHAFDAPSREACTARRNVSNTPSAALVLLNEPVFVAAARGLATRVLDDPGPHGPLVRAFRLATSRAPTPAEVDVLSGALTAARARFAQQPAAAARLAADAANGPHSAVEVAAWTQVARVILNLHEVICRD